MAVNTIGAGVILNEGSIDVDLRVESNGNANMLVVDGGNDRVGIGAVPTAAKLEIHGGAFNTSLLIKGSGADTGIKFVDSAGNADGYVYAAGGEVGFLDDDAEWMVNCVTDTRVELRVANVKKFIVDANSSISLSNNDSGTSNTVFGKNAGASIDAGSNYNVFIGENVSDATMNDAVKNVGVGYGALSALTTGDQNIAIGYNALTANTTGLENIAIGRDAMDACVSGDYNIGIGSNALGTLGDVASDFNVAIGYDAMGTASHGNIDGCIAIGRSTLYAVGDGTLGTIAIGNQALTALTTGSNNIAIGYGASAYLTTGSANTVIGYEAFDNANGSESNNTAIGSHALSAFTADGTNRNTAVGVMALGTAQAGNNNTAIGSRAISNALVTGDNNTAVGESALYALTSGHSCVAVGANALDANTTGDSNNAFGLNALGVNTTARANNAFGNSALGNNTDGADNTAMGHVAMADNNTGTSNTAFGSVALNANTSGSYNTAVGKSAGDAINEGTHNTCIGFDAGTGDVNLTTGDYCTVIGSNSDISTADAQGQIALGYNVSCTANTTVTIGYGANTASLGLDGSDTSWAAASSDERYKENIETSTAGLSFVNDLRPVTYNWKKEKDVPSDMPSYKEGSDEPVLGYEYGETLHGFIAQEVKATIDEHSEIKEGFKMWILKDDGVQTVADGNLVPILVKAVQELSQQVEDLKKKVGG